MVSKNSYLRNLINYVLCGRILPLTYQSVMFAPIAAYLNVCYPKNIHSSIFKV